MLHHITVKLRKVKWTGWCETILNNNCETQ